MVLRRRAPLPERAAVEVRRRAVLSLAGTMSMSYLGLAWFL